MLGMLLNERECKEFDYLLRREMDEILLDMNDRRIDKAVKINMIERYKVIFRMYARLAPAKEVSKYTLNYKERP
ncbi:hypothetical protein [Longirhabdus pacifica]|uniref:hypothetical protein n=1 Tax=Longirhabdus pacifica TaxID=2305227 RepID=UPI001008C686|nr:hypothetical protein [Longirhabdus pacifica]